MPFVEILNKKTGEWEYVPGTEHLPAHIEPNRITCGDLKSTWAMIKADLTGKQWRETSTFTGDTCP